MSTVRAKDFSSTYSPLLLSCFAAHWAGTCFDPFCGVGKGISYETGYGLSTGLSTIRRDQYRWRGTAIEADTYATQIGFVARESIEWVSERKER